MRPVKLAVCIALAAWLCVGAAVSARAQAGAPPVPHGIMAFGWARNFLDTKSIDLPYVSGMTGFFGWRDMEKEDGVYDFKDIDYLLARAKAKGKLLNLMFSPGRHAPDWLFKKGAKSFSWETPFTEDQWQRQGRSQVMTVPIPWDPIYQEHWKRFINKIAERYGSEPAIGYISLTGPVMRGLTTTIPITNDADWQRLVASGYSDERLISAWTDMIEFYEKVLPNKRLVLAIAPERRGRRDIWLAKALVQYVEQKRYGNISFFMVFLNDTWFPRARIIGTLRDLVKDAKARGFTFGYQVAQSAHRNAQWRRNRPIVKDLRDTLAIGIADGASWIEVWHDDIIDPKGREEGVPNARYAADLKWAQEALLSGAPR